MSSAKPPEFFFDRSLGKTSARRLRDQGHVVHLVADFYPDDAQAIPDEEWIAEGCARGWVLLTKDKRIRYRTQELAALQNGFLFCLADGNASLDAISGAWAAAIPAITRAVWRGATGFSHVYAERRIKLMWP
jgi:hypothetical protein